MRFQFLTAFLLVAFVDARRSPGTAPKRAFGVQSPYSFGVDQPKKDVNTVKEVKNGTFGLETAFIGRIASKSPLDYFGTTEFSFLPYSSVYSIYFFSQLVVNDNDVPPQSKSPHLLLGSTKSCKPSKRPCPAWNKHRAGPSRLSSRRIR